MKRALGTRVHSLLAWTGATTGVLRTCTFTMARFEFRWQLIMPCYERRQQALGMRGHPRGTRSCAERLERDGSPLRHNTPPPLMSGTRIGTRIMDPGLNLRSREIHTTIYLFSLFVALTIFKHCISTCTSKNSSTF